MLSWKLLVFSKSRTKSTYLKACQYFCSLNGCMRSSHSSAGFCPVLSFLPCGMRVRRVVPGSWAAGSATCLQRGFTTNCCITLLLLSVISSCCDFPSPSPLVDSRTRNLCPRHRGTSSFLWLQWSCGEGEKEREKHL